MSVIAQIGLSQGKPCAIIITVSDKLYKKYKMESLPIKNPISADLFREFLNKHNIPFVQNESATIMYGEKHFSIAMWKEAEFFAAEDIKNALSNCPIKNYNDFVDYYAEYLKTL
jgi:hypothetical protein